MKKMLFLSATFMALTCYCFAQTKGLKLGDPIPNYTFTDLINYPQKAVTVKELRGKYIILDFWFIHCASCVRAFPHLNELQEKFKDKLQILLINRVDKAEAVKTFFSAFKKKSGIDINLAVQCGNPELLYEYFPNGSNPHEVIIDPDGNVYAITDAESLSTENITAMLAGKKVDFPLKDDYWNRNLSLVASSNEVDNHGILVNSSLTGYFPNLLSASKSNEKGELIGVIETNRPLIQFYKEAYPSLFKEVSSPQIIYETENPVFRYKEGDRTKLFSYDIIAPPGILNWTPTDNNFQQFLGQDLDRAFRFSLRREKRVLNCLIIKANGGIKKSATKYSISDDNIGYISGAMRNHLQVYMHKGPLRAISWILSYALFFDRAKTNVLVEEAGSIEFDLDFPVGFDFTNKETLLTFLHEKGIDISFESRELDCVIISDKKPGESTILNSK